ncbi:MAG: CRTAC1 family protein [Bryobacteraceae bacterium]|nr:CRTAC1 family protein [Bryobacteraceae bacterium]
MASATLRKLSPLFALFLTAQTSPQFVALPPASTGIVWRHHNAKSAARHLPETVGPGVAVLDFDNDGLMDLYFVNSGPSDFFAPKAPLRNALYRNLGRNRFRDVTLEAQVSGRDFGMGAAAADYDNDGDTDLFVANYGSNILYRNEGNGTFRDVTAAAGLDHRAWHTSAVWFDYDRDAHLDLFVANYVHYEKKLVDLCFDRILKISAYCVPKLFASTSSLLYRNRGDGTFEDVSGRSGIAAYAGKAFGAVATDIDNDGWLDLFVASDMAPNALFRNRRDGTFEDIGLTAGVAYSQAGEPRSGMGADATDFDGDGWQDLFVANIDQQFFALYRNLRNGEFREEPGEIRRDTRLLSGWGLKFFDFDNDGDDDLLLANGHPDDNIARRMPGVTYAEPFLLFENRSGVFKNASHLLGTLAAQKVNARGLAIADIDNDGALDAIVGVNNGAPLILHNRAPQKHNWVGLNFDRSLVGGRIRWTASGKVYTRQIAAGGSFLSSHDPRVLLGLGDATQVGPIEITWPSGAKTSIENARPNAYQKVAFPR